MFACNTCKSQEFKLMLQPGFQGAVTTQITEQGNVEITAGNKTFIADLWFMNQFAICKQCDAIAAWTYYYPPE